MFSVALHVFCVDGLWSFARSPAVRLGKLRACPDWRQAKGKSRPCKYKRCFSKKRRQIQDVEDSTKEIQSSIRSSALLLTTLKVEISRGSQPRRNSTKFGRLDLI